MLAPDEMRGLSSQLQEEQLPGPLAALGVLSGLLCKRRVGSATPSSRGLPGHLSAKFQHQATVTQGHPALLKISVDMETNTPPAHSSCMANGSSTHFNSIHKIIEWFRLEKSSKIIKSKHYMLKNMIQNNCLILILC